MENWNCKFGLKKKCSLSFFENDFPAAKKMVKNDKVRLKQGDILFITIYNLIEINRGLIISLIVNMIKRINKFGFQN
jgi:hypothetical protein